MHKTHKTSRFLAIVLLLAMLMSIGVYATDAQVEAPAAALNAEEHTPGLTQKFILFLRGMKLFNIFVEIFRAIRK